MNNKSEGKNLTENYSWFKDVNVIENFVDSIDEIASRLPEEVHILGIGSGLGNLEYSVKSFLESKYNKVVKLTITDRNIKDTIKLDGTSVIVVENNNLPFPDNQFDLVVARSVTHYEKTNEDEMKVLNEIKRVLKKNGYFVNETLYIENQLEIDLLKNVHRCVSKDMNLKNKSNTIELHKNVFGRVFLSEHQPNISLVVTKENFIRRYKIDEKTLTTIIEMINAYDPLNIPNIRFSKEDFEFRISYLTIFCQVY